MSKIGVGVGDEFPVDDGAPRNPGDAPRDDRAEFEDWKRRRDAHRAQREAWRAQKDEWRRRRDEWKAQSRAWRDEHRDTLRGAFRDDYGYGHRYGRGYSPFFYGHGLMRLVMFVLVIALIVFAFSHIGYILVGLLAVAALFAAYHRFGHDPFDLGPRERDYARPMTTPPVAPAPPATTPQDPAA